MKKIIVMVALVTLAATSAFAGIQNTAHDLSGRGTGVDEICAFCHTPHSGGTQAPLWNRGNGPAVTQQYSSISMDATPGSGTSDAPLCLSCHDSATIDTLVITNTPNSKTYNPAGLTLNANADLGTDLSNDHPVGFDITTAGLEINATPANAPLFGAGNDVWCSSCHDVHNNTNAPFLIMTNTNSALCLDCHNK
ncbi:cytochrome c3 family protein [Deltaproteobacteria bacterium IMCC39524]|nr:cytochrome c3 family protein [Deltaproteobacteria bacterium IMCC39524]